MIYLLNGMLPWERLNAKDKQKKYKMIYNMKKNTSAENLVGDKSNQEFIDFISYCKNLKFEETPDYNYLRGLMIKAINRKYSSITKKIASTKNFPLLRRFSTMVQVIPSFGNEQGLNDKNKNDNNKNDKDNQQNDDDCFNDSFNCTRSVSESITGLDEIIKTHSFKKVSILDNKKSIKKVTTFSYKDLNDDSDNDKFAYNKRFSENDKYDNSYSGSNYNSYNNRVQSSYHRSKTGIINTSPNFLARNYLKPKRASIIVSSKSIPGKNYSFTKNGDNNNVKNKKNIFNYRDIHKKNSIRIKNKEECLIF